MKILVDILHPAHIHFFKNFIWEMEQKGHEVIITARDKDCTLKLLNTYGFKYKCLSKIANKKIGLGFELLKRTRKLISICRKEKPDLLMGIMGAIIAPVGKILRIPSYVFYNTENAKLTNKYVYRMATKFITPDCYEDKVPKKIHVEYEGYHALAYLHKNRFTSDVNIITKKGLIPKEYIVLRLVSWQASHDIKDEGVTDIPGLIKELEKYGRVIITSEKEMPPEFEKYKVPCSIEEIHHVLAFAKLVIGESHTMASEAACLGTPAITISKSRRGFTNDLYRYRMIFNCSTQEFALLTLETLDFSVFPKNHEILMNRKIDVTDWMVQFVNRNFLN